MPPEHTLKIIDLLRAVRAAGLADEQVGFRTVHHTLLELGVDVPPGLILSSLSSATETGLLKHDTHGYSITNRARRVLAGREDIPAT